MTQPKVRLKGFSGEWEEKSFSDTFSYIANNTLSRAELCNKSNNAANIHYGDVLIKYGEILDCSKEELTYITDDKVSDYLVKKGTLCNGDIVFADTAEDEAVGKCSEIYGITEFEIVSGLHTIPCHPKFEFAPCYLGYYLNSTCYHDQLLPLMQGIKVLSLSKGAFEKTDISYPTDLSEQRAIASYFRSLDALISSTSGKIDSLKQMKAACLQNMFPQKGEKTPKVRFKGFSGEWEEKKLNSFTTRITRKNEKLESTLPLTISAQYGLIDQITYFNNRVASTNLTGYYLIKKGEFAYNKSYSTDYPWGAVKRLDKYKVGVLSTLYIIFALNENSINSDYLSIFFESNLWYKHVSEKAEEGARNHGLLNISAEDFLEMYILVPDSLSEQQKIASFFRSLDTQINIQEQRLEKLKQLKAACLDQMFV